MNYAIRRHAVITSLFSIACAVGSICCSRDAGCQLAATAAEKVQIRAAFSEALSVVCRRWHVAIIAEGRPVIGPKDPQNVSFDPSSSIGSTVRLVAASYDYSVVDHNPVFVLQKRFTLHHDLPDLTLEELAYATATIDQILSAFNPAYPASDPAGSPRGIALKNALTQQQIAQLAQSGVPVSSLTEAQRAEVWRFAMSFYLQSAADRANLAARIASELAANRASFRWTNFNGRDEFGFEVMCGLPSGPSFQPLSNPDTLIVQPRGAVVRLGFGAAGSPQPADGSSPNQEDEDEVKTDEQSSGDTLSSVVARLTTKDSHNYTLSVFRAYRSKSVTVAGESNVDASHLMAGLAEVYGLTLRRDASGGQIITHADPPPVSDLTEALRAIQAVIPVNIYRLLGVSHDEIAAKDPRTRPNPSIATRLRDVLCVSERLVRASTQPVVARSKMTHSVPLSYFPENTRKILASSRMASCFGGSYELINNPIPTHIRHFQDMVLTGGLTWDGKHNRISVLFTPRDLPPSTNPAAVRGTGISNAIVP